MKMELRSKAIDKVYKRRDRIDMPDFQREEVWPPEKKKLLIDSILREYHLPKFYFRKIDDNNFECVDGQQRLNAIFEFFDGTLTLDEHLSNKYGGPKYEDLPDDVSDRFDDFQIDIEEIENPGEQELEDLFQRLQLGTPLNTAERLNAISSELGDFCWSIAKKPFFTQKIPVKNTRYSHFETIVKWFYIEARGIQPQMRFPQLESLLKDNRTFSSTSDTAKKIIEAVNYLNSCFPEKCIVISNRANLLSVCMLASRIAAQDLHKNSFNNFNNFTMDFFNRLATEVEKGVKSTDTELLRYQQAITSGSTGGISIQERINILTKSLASYSPKYSKLLGTYQDSKNEAIQNISELSSEIQKLVYDVNKTYSSKNGIDLFKMTTESSSSLSKLSTLIYNSDLFSNFIDSLYFLIYEGSGNCKRLGSPPPDFSMDIKFLRTLFRHDIDHGDEKDVSRKRIRNAEILEKYSGKKSIGECSSEDLLTAQIRILNEAIRFLSSLK
ncbi:MAG: DUF262 domain-containing protein [Chitinispirillaceae bacterium]